MDWEKQRILISGIDGFIGSHIAKRLVGLGSEIYGILKGEIVEGKSGILLWDIQDRIRNYIGDIADLSFVRHVLDESKPHWVFHLAAQSIVTEAQNYPLKTFQTNIVGTLNVLSACHNLNEFKGVIVASSDKAYGNSNELPYIESSPLRGGSVYDTSKACADLLSSCFSKWSNIQLGITRCANTFGPGDLNFSRIIPDVLREISAKRAPVIYGDGLHERDFIYVDDVVSGYLKIAEYMDVNVTKGETFNLGTGVPTKVKDIVNKIILLSALDIGRPKVLGRAKPAEISCQYVNSDKARTKLDWAPEYSLEEGLMKTIKWYLEYLV
jgi:CDP-glucose 4,6-dehydratase